MRLSRVVPLLVAIAVAGLLSGCAAAEPAPPPSTTPASSAPPTEPSTPSEPTSAAAGTVPVQPGDCAFDPEAFGAVTFSVYADDDTTPIEVTYSVFREGTQPEVRTITTTGPVVTILQTDCGDPVASEPWTFTATSATGNSLGCSFFFGGLSVKTDTDYAEGDVARGTSVDCSGHPGM